MTTTITFHSRRLALALLLLGLATAPAALQDATPTPRDCPAFATAEASARIPYYMGEGRAYMQAFQYSEAIYSYSCIIEQVDEDHVPAYTARAVAYTQLRDFDAALEDYNAALERDGSRPDILNNRAVVYMAQGEYEKALADLEAALGEDDTYTLARNNRGVLKAITGDYEGAIADFEQAIEQSGIDDVLAELTREDRSPDAERPDYDTADAQPYAMLGIVYSQIALDQYDAYLMLRPNDADHRIANAAGALESRFAFELRLDDGSWLLVATFKDE
jgi:tetratricopeptide (TPR) repeat protein